MSIIITRQKPKKYSILLKTLERLLCNYIHRFQFLPNSFFFLDSNLDAVLIVFLAAVASFPHAPYETECSLQSHILDKI